MSLITQGLDQMGAEGIMRAINWIDANPGKLLLDGHLVDKDGRC